MSQRIDTASHTRENKLRRHADRLGYRMIRVPNDRLHPHLGLRYLVLDPATATVLSPTLVGLDELAEWLSAARERTAAQMAAAR